MTLTDQADALFRKHFRAAPAAIAGAPGRIEVIGNHTDYNCGTVMGASIDRGITVAARLRSDGVLAFVSAESGHPVEVRERPFKRRSGPQSWVNYPLGVLLALEARGMAPVSGLELAVVSDLPVGAGLSSSAALELSTGLAIAALQRFDLPREELVKAGREAENNFVGVPCGILDQGVSGFGRRDHLVHIDCRGPRFEPAPLPSGLRFWTFHTHHKHALVDSLYARRHAECMEAAKALGVRWLADATPGMVLAARDAMAPDVFKRARHVVEEIARVGAVRAALAAGDAAEVGRALFASHESSRTLFENSTPELDFLVDALRGRAGVVGARLTGGGFGGAVMALASPEFTEAEAGRVADAYAAKHGGRPDVLACATADGARLLRG